VGKDVAGSLLLALAVHTELLLVLECHLAVVNDSGLWERLIVALSILRAESFDGLSDIAEVWGASREEGQRTGAVWLLPDDT
jgi:hypothetical protein